MAVTLVGDVLADELLAAPVVIGGIYEIDAFVEDGIQDRFRLLIRDRTAVPDAGTADLHRSKAQARDVQARAAQNRSG